MESCLVFLGTFSECRSPKVRDTSPVDCAAAPSLTSPPSTTTPQPCSRAPSAAGGGLREGSFSVAINSDLLPRGDGIVVVVVVAVAVMPLLPPLLVSSGVGDCAAAFSCSSASSSLDSCWKCSKSQARRTLTDLSGSPLWGRQASESIIPIWLSAFCCRNFWSSILSRGVSPLVSPEDPVGSFSPSTLYVSFICTIIASFMHRKCRDIAFCASVVYGAAAP
nr:Os03g0732700 [Ipomoea batatas]